MSDQIILAVIILLIIILAWRLGDVISMELLSRKSVSQHSENVLAANLWQLPNSQQNLPKSRQISREHITADSESQRWTDKITAESPWMRIAETRLQDGLYSL